MHAYLNEDLCALNMAASQTIGGLDHFVCVLDLDTHAGFLEDTI